VRESRVTEGRLAVQQFEVWPIEQAGSRLTRPMRMDGEMRRVSDAFGCRRAVNVS